MSWYLGRKKMPCILFQVPKGFECPKCHQYVDSPNVLEGPASWAESLPQNQFIIGLIEAVKLRSEGRKCDPCDKRGERSLAMKWCENCGEAMCEDCEKQHNSLKVYCLFKSANAKDRWKAILWI